MPSNQDHSCSCTIGILLLCSCHNIATQFCMNLGKIRIAATCLDNKVSVSFLAFFLKFALLNAACISPLSLVSLKSFLLTQQLAVIVQAIPNRQLVSNISKTMATDSSKTPATNSNKAATAPTIGTHSSNNSKIPATNSSSHSHNRCISNGTKHQQQQATAIPAASTTLAKQSGTLS